MKRRVKAWAYIYADGTLGLPIGFDLETTLHIAEQIPYAQLTRVIVEYDDGKPAKRKRGKK